MSSQIKSYFKVGRQRRGSGKSKKVERHKNDFRDAETMLDLLMRGDFPAIVPRSEQSRELLDLLNYRQALVRKRTSVANQIHAFAKACW